jgi:hypothetical protein
MTAYTALCTREDDMWVIHVPELDRTTQARRLDQVEATVRSLVTLILDVPADSFTIDVRPQLPRGVTNELRVAEEARARAEEAARQSSIATRRAAQDLADMGLTVRDIGAALKISPQRVSQLIGARHRAAS